MVGALETHEAMNAMDRTEPLDRLVAGRARAGEPAIPVARSGRAASSTWRWAAAAGRVHIALPDEDAWTSLDHELRTLADILPFLVSRDDELPATWRSPAFGRQVALVRSRVTTIANRRHLAARLAPDGIAEEAGRFERGARRLAADPTAVALAIRCLEIEDDARFPSWSEILRRRMLHPAPLDRASVEASSWFG
jgi:hypothetical protein